MRGPLVRGLTALCFTIPLLLASIYPGTGLAVPATLATCCEVPPHGHPPLSGSLQLGGLGSSQPPASGGVTVIGSGVAGAPQRDPASTAGSGLTLTGGLGPPTGVAPLNVSFLYAEQGGIPPITFTFVFGDGSNYTSSSGNTTHVYSSIGKYLATIYLNDSNDSVNATAWITVVSQGVSASTPVASPASVDFGQNVTFTTTATGGTGVYSYGWQTLPSSCPPVNSSSITCQVTSGSRYSVSVIVTDSAGNWQWTSPVSGPIYADPAITVLSSQPDAIDLGQTFTFEAYVSGGSGDFSYAWSDLPQGCSSANSATISCDPLYPGTYFPRVSATDSNGESTNLTGGPDYVAPGLLISTPKASMGTLDVGQTVSFTTSATGGSGGFSYSWTGLPSGCLSANTTSLQCTPAAAGTFHVVATVTDIRADTVPSGQTNVTVDASLGASLYATNLTPRVGASFSIVGAASAGTPPYSVSFRDLPPGCSSGISDASTVNCSANVSGTYTVTFTVQDRVGQVVSASVTLTVQPASQPQTTPLPTWIWWSAALTVVGIGAAVGAIIYRRRRIPPADPLASG
jgi:hypothetical protein